MDIQVLKHMSDKIQEDVSKISDDLASGKATDYGDYKYYAGIVRGLRMANNILLETAEQMEKFEND